MLPWHHFVSPWLERDDDSTEDKAEPSPETIAEPEPDEQLTLELGVLVGALDDVPEESAA